MSNFLSASSLCSNPTQCTAFHELSAHMSEMNTKLTSLLSLTQMFFQSWRTENLKQQAGQAEILKKVIESQNQIRAIQSANFLPPTRPPKKYQSAMAAQNSTNPDWTFSPEALPVEKNCASENAGNGVSNLASPKNSVGTSEVVSGGTAERTEVVSGINTEELEDEEEMFESGGHNNDDPGFDGGDLLDESCPSGSNFGFGGGSQARRFRLQTRNFPQSVEELRRHIILFPGHVVTPRALSRVGSLAYFRKKKMIAYDVLKVNVDALRQEKILTQQGYRLPHFKVHPNKLTAEHKALLSKYKVSIEEYTEAYSSPPYNLSEKRRPDDFSNVTMVKDWSFMGAKLGFDEAKKYNFSGGKFLDSLGLEMPRISESVSPQDHGDETPDQNAEGNSA